MVFLKPLTHPSLKMVGFFKFAQLFYLLLKVLLLRLSLIIMRKLESAYLKILTCWGKLHVSQNDFSIILTSFVYFPDVCKIIRIKEINFLFLFFQNRLYC